MFAGIDRPVYEFFINNRTDLLNSFFIFITSFGEIWFLSVLVPLTLYFLYKKKQKILMIYLGLNVSVGVILVYFLKNILERPRPPVENSLVFETSYSFPSGHAVLAVVFYFSILVMINTFPLLLKRVYRNILNFLLFILIVLIPISRLYLGVHWFSDIITGIVLGLITVYSSRYLLRIDKIKTAKRRSVK
jgi:undecaprenyl-diphosphatase